ncbi:hypothetical protein ACFQ67_12580 [Streptomyces sp. NPDC056488]|uniref:hypothetical protein n=1 Tax=Streptomyces sp. NPDC056488 TaxID=3345836 RepID=UPI0036B68931
MSSDTHVHRRYGRRTAMAAGLVLAVGLGASAQATAQATAPAKTSAKASTALRSVNGFNGEVVAQVADFYGAYIDAKDDPNGPDATLAGALRAHYLAPAFAARLKTWEKKNKADGVLRAQNVPVDWTVSESRNGRDIVVTHNFGGGEAPTVRTDLVVELEPVFGDVADIRATSAR